MVEGSQFRTLMPKFTVVSIEMWAYCPKIIKIGNFAINLPLVIKELE